MKQMVAIITMRNHSLKGLCSSFPGEKQKRNKKNIKSKLEAAGKRNDEAWVIRQLRFELPVLGGVGQVA